MDKYLLKATQYALVVMLVVVSTGYAHQITGRQTGTLTHYGTGDGFMGQRTSCGKIVTPRSMYVAALDVSIAHCGMKLTIYYRGKKYHTRVQDRGAFGRGRTIDAAPGLRKKMGVSGVVKVNYTTGWR